MALPRTLSGCGQGDDSVGWRGDRDADRGAEVLAGVIAAVGAAIVAASSPKWASGRVFKGDRPRKDVCPEQLGAVRRPLLGDELEFRLHDLRCEEASAIRRQVDTCRFVRPPQLRVTDQVRSRAMSPVEVYAIVSE